MCVRPGERHHGQHAQWPPPASGPAGRDLRHARGLRADAAVHAADGRQRHQAAAGPPGLGQGQGGPGLRGSADGQRGVLQVRRRAVAVVHRAVVVCYTQEKNTNLNADFLRRL